MTFKKLVTCCLLGCGALFGQQPKVNHFTGDLNYSLPLLSVPAPGGGDIPIAIKYTSGIGVDQRASEVGLGWSISAGGSILRSVVDLPDDWKNKNTPNSTKGKFETQNGILHMGDDYTQSFHKLDPKEPFYFPGYDRFYLSGIQNGSMQFRIFDFYRINVDLDNKDHKVLSGTYSSDPKLHINGDFHGEMSSRHYSGGSLSTPYYFPGDVVSGSSDSYEGTGYNGTDDRIVSAHYVEYFTNKEINDHLTGVAPISGFIDVNSSFVRNSSSTDLDGIGAIRVTTPSGLVYHYSLPVYEHKRVKGSYPLDHDYNTGDYSDQHIRTQSGGILVKNSDSLLVEYTSEIKTAVSWMLTAITGIEYVDQSPLGVVDENDKGYWVSFEYQKWTDHFRDRNIPYGFREGYSPSYDAKTKELAIGDQEKQADKFANYVGREYQIYYLNRIKTATHSAIFIRDFRLDDCSVPKGYDHPQQLNDFKYNMIKDETNTVSAWEGNLYDDGGPTGNMGDGNSSYDVSTVTLAPEGASQLTLTVQSFDFNNNQDEYVEIYDGPSTSATLLGRFGSNANFHNPNSYASTGSSLNVGAQIQSSGSTLTIKLFSKHNNKSGFDFSWASAWQGGDPLLTPRLKLSRIILMANEKLDAITSPSQVWMGGTSPGYHSRWDLQNVAYSLPEIYHGKWYSDHELLINSYSLTTIEFEQNYSLARKYHGNVHVQPSQMTYKNQSLSTVAGLITTSDLENSGKLTLNKVITYDKGHQQTAPSIVFNYNTTDADHNPYYDPRAKDYWGYHKSDITSAGHSRYTTTASKDHVAAWSMVSVIDPMGGVTDIEYESDDYNKVLKDQPGGGFMGAERTYPIQLIGPDMSNKGSGWIYSLEDVVQDFTDLRNSGEDWHAVIPFKGTGNCHFDLYNYISYGGSSMTSSTISGMTLYRYDGTTWVDNVPSSHLGGGCDASTMPYTGQGYISFQLDPGDRVYGGGVRVKSITRKNDIVDSYKTLYEYFDGVATSEADRFSRTRTYPDPASNDIYLRLDGLSYDKHRLSPMVGYTQVKVSELGQVSTSRGHTLYSFTTSDENKGNYDPEIDFEHKKKSDNISCDLSPTTLDTLKPIRVENRFTALWGKLREVEVKNNNNITVSKTTHEYTSMDQGMVAEVFGFRTRYHDPSGEVFACPNTTFQISILEDYPARLTKTTKVIKGHSFVDQNLAFDNVNGVPTKVESNNPIEGTHVMERTSAFQIADYSTMGPKSKNSTNSNQLLHLASMKTQEDPSYTSTNFSGQRVTEFSDQVMVRRYDAGSGLYKNNQETVAYRPVSNYAWSGPLETHGVFDMTAFTAFDYDPSASNVDDWRLDVEHTKYDDGGNAIESRGFSERYIASKYVHDNRFKLAGCDNCNHNSFTHTGFEESVNEGTTGSPVWFFEGEVSMGEATTIVTPAHLIHSGHRSISLNEGEAGPTFIARYDNSDPANSFQRGRTYRASVWVHQQSATAKLTINLTGSHTASATVNISDPSVISAGPWRQLNVELEVPDNYVSTSASDGMKVQISSTGGVSYFDDLRVHSTVSPTTAEITDPETGRVMATLDEYNYTIKYEYDAAGRVINSWKELENVGMKKMEHKEYNYARDMEP